MPRVLILGYGNTLRGDDAVGPLVAERLQRPLSDPEIEIRALHQLTPEVMEPISRAQRVIFIDAALGPDPGTITEREVIPDPSTRLFTHHATPESLLSGARTLYGSAPPATMITITAANFDIGEGLSEAGQNALASVVKRLEMLLRQSIPDF